MFLLLFPSLGWESNNKSALPPLPSGDGKPYDKHITGTSTPSTICDAPESCSCRQRAERSGGTTKSQRKTAGEPGRDEKEKKKNSSSSSSFLSAPPLYYHQHPSLLSDKRVKQRRKRRTDSGFWIPSALYSLLYLSGCSLREAASSRGCFSSLLSARHLHADT